MKPGPRKKNGYTGNLKREGEDRLRKFREVALAADFTACYRLDTSKMAFTFMVEDTRVISIANLQPSINASRPCSNPINLALIFQYHT